MAKGIPQDPELRQAIEALGNAVLPFAEWEPKAKLPSSVWDIGAYDVLDELIGDSDFDEALIERWKAVALKPLERFPEPDRSDPPQTPEEWRTTHGFTQPPRFDMDAKNKPVGRRAFYNLYWTTFVAAVRSAQKEPDFTWFAFADRLLKETGAPHWPAESAKSSPFLSALIRDISIAVLGMKNWDATSKPQKNVFLQALGERRFVGNKHTRDDVEHATTTFRQQLDTEWNKGVQP